KRHDRVVVRQVLEIRRIEGRRELLLEEFRVGGTDTEARLRTDVADDRIADLLVELRDELVRDDERELVFSGFREDRGDRWCREVLELVDVEIESRIVV